MRILGIETSCDETGAAVVEKLTSGKLKILSNIIASSQDMHAKTGGVIPENAAREQIKSIIPVIQNALSELNDPEGRSIDAIAVTIGPGLIGSLLVGVETAKTLSYLWNKPIIPINHLVGHVYANFLNNTPQFPALALVVSGGHTDLVYIKSHGNIKYVGGTRDDAAGEAFDKIARLLNLPYPGGPNLSKEAQKYLDKFPNEKLNLFPRPMTKSQGSLMINENNFDWSFSGLKTSVSNFVKNNPNLDKEKIAAEVQEAIVDCLIQKSFKAIEKFKPKSFLLAGGVAANSRLRKKFQRGTTYLSATRTVHGSGKLPQISVHIPEISLCTDNAAPIAAAALFTGKEIPWQKIDANPELTITDLI